MWIFKWTFAFFDWELFGILRAKVCSNAKKGTLIRWRPACLFVLLLSFR